MNRHHIILIFIQGGLLVFELFAPYDSLSRRIALMITNLVPLLAVILIERWHQRHGWPPFPVAALWCTFGAVWLDALGNFFGWYGRWWWWDHLTHGVGTSAIAILAGSLLLVRPGIVWSRRWLLVVALMISQTIAAWYEVSEYLGDLAFGTQRVGPGLDTARDLWFNLLGGLLGILLLRAAFWRSSKKVV